MSLSMIEGTSVETGRGIDGGVIERGEDDGSVNDSK